MEPTRRNEILRHARLLDAFAGQDYQFDPPDGPSLRGFASDSVIELVEGPSTRLSLLISSSRRQTTACRAAARVATVTSLFDVDCGRWLARQIGHETHRHPSGHRSSKWYGQVRVSAEHLGADAILVTIETGLAHN